MRFTTIYHSFCILLICFLGQITFSQVTLIPDQQFEQALIDLGIDTTSTPDGQVLTSAISDISILDIQGLNISDLTGIQDFSSLVELQCKENNLTTLDLSGNPNLVELKCNLNDLTSLNVSNNPSLELLYAGANNLSSIDLSGNPNLQFLRLPENNFSSIDVSNNAQLIQLLINGNSLTEINTINNTNLTGFNVGENPMTAIDISHLSLLEAFRARFSQIEFIDVSNLTNLNIVDMEFGNLKAANFKNGGGSTNEPATVKLEENPDLSCVLVDDVNWAQNETGWGIPVTAEYVESSYLFIDVDSDDFFTVSDGAGNVAELTTYINSNGNATASSNLCGALTWTYEYTLHPSDTEERIDYLFYFTVTDIFGNQATTGLSIFVIDNVLPLGVDDAGTGEQICSDVFPTFDLNTVDPFVDLNSPDIDNFYFNQIIVPAEDGGGPMGAAYNGTEVDFPDTGAGSYTYQFSVSIEKMVSVFDPVSGNIVPTIYTDEAVLTINEYIVAFNSGPDKTITVCPGEVLTIQNLTDALSIDPDPNIFPPQPLSFFPVIVPVDLNSYWSPDNYEGPGEYVFNPSVDFLDCNPTIAQITVVESNLTVGVSTTIDTCQGVGVTELDLLNALGADSGGFWTPSINPQEILPGLYTYQFEYCTAAGQSTIQVNEQSNLLNIKAFLQGALINPNPGEESLMRDDLRVLRYVPTDSPYGDISCSPAVFNVLGNDAIVDWIWLEFRDKNNSSQVLSSRSALLQRDGDIVDVDGISPITSGMIDDYFLAINHRNHSAVMSNLPIILDCAGPFAVDFSNPSFSTFGSNAQTTFGAPVDTVAMWAGDVNGDGQLKYLGPNNDTNTIKDFILDPENGNPTGSNFYTYMGYDNADIDMNGRIKYLGPNNDTNSLKDIILSHPDNTTSSNFFPIFAQLPE